MPVGDVIQLSVEQSLYGQRIVNVFHYEVDADANGGFNNEVALLTAFNSQVINVSWKAAVSTSLLYHCLRSRRIFPEAGSEEVATITAPLSGTISGEAFNASTVAVVVNKTAVGGPRSNGRKFISGIPTAGESDNNMTSAQWTLVVAFANALDAQISQDAAGTGRYTPGIAPAGIGKPFLAFVPLLHNVRSPLHKLRSRTPKICGGV